MNTEEVPELVLTSAAARIIGVSPATIHLWERSGRLPAFIKTSHGIRLFNRIDVERLARERVEKSALTPSPEAA